MKINFIDPLGRQPTMPLLSDVQGYVSNNCKFSTKFENHEPCNKNHNPDANIE